MRIIWCGTREGEAGGPHTYQRSVGAHERSRGGVPTHARSTLRHPVPSCHFFFLTEAC